MEVLLCKHIDRFDYQTVIPYGNIASRFHLAGLLKQRIIERGVHKKFNYRLHVALFILSHSLTSKSF